MAFDVGTIDSISRQLGRNVLFLALLDDEDEALDIYAEVDPITEWLEVNNIDFRLCTAFSPDVVYIEGGPACIYLDVTPERDTEKLALLVNRFGQVDGTPVQDGFQLSILKLDDAMKNAEQDDPDFWDDFV